MNTRIKVQANPAPTHGRGQLALLTAFLSLAFLIILGCGTHSLEDLLNAGSSSSEASSSLPSSSSLSSSSEAISSSSSSSSGNGGGSGSLTYQGQTYRTVVIGTQTWMAENLNYDVSGSGCYYNKTENCQKYGRLYDFATATTVCPSGWHLPSYTDWNKLLDYVESSKGCTDCAGKYLKAASGWDSYSGIVNLDTYGFSALPGGSCGSFCDGAGCGGYWWSSTVRTVNASVNTNMSCSYDDAYLRNSASRGLFYSVRCVQD